MAEPSSPLAPGAPSARGSAGPFRREAGLLLHPTSLPAAHGIGDLGHGARRLIDWLVEAGLAVWQVLPLVPPGAGMSPYSSPSSMALSPLMADLHGLARDGLLQGHELAPPAGGDVDRVDERVVRPFKDSRLRLATARLLERPATDPLRAAHDAWAEAQAGWVRDWALFAALAEARDGRPWWRWEPPLRDRQPKALRAEATRLQATVAHHVAVQFLIERQWREVLAYARARGVRVLGDLPIYVDRHSADVWAHRDQFRVLPDGRPEAVSGCPPDAFSEDGQYWGNPLFDWARMAGEGYAWWVARLGRTLDLVDLVRIDHFRAFSAFWEIPFDAPTARDGRWVAGPGYGFFDAMAKGLGYSHPRELPIVAEDLGTLDQDVHDLRDAVGLPGMAILQFAFGAELDHAYLPHSVDRRSVIYTGTHDNDTARGWWETAPEAVRDHVRRYLAVDGHDVVWDLIRACWRAPSDLAVVPMQDVLVLDGGARMNVPGRGWGNWTWRVREEAFDGGIAARLRDLGALYTRRAPATEG